MSGEGEVLWLVLSMFTIMLDPQFQCNIKISYFLKGFLTLLGRPFSMWSEIINYFVPNPQRHLAISQNILWKFLWPLHKKWSFPFRICWANVKTSAGNCRFGHIFCAVWLYSLKPHCFPLHIYDRVFLRKLLITFSW